MNQTDVDVSHLVDAAFKEQDCASMISGVSCAGEHRAYMVGHDCAVGFLCQSHFENYIANARPAQIEKFRANGYIRCTRCREEFYDLDQFSKVYPL